MFKVKAKVVNILGDESTYPCHFNYNIGDEIIFDGEKCTGRVCPALWEKFAPVFSALHNAGPRYRPPIHYVPFLYAAPNVRDLSMKKYDGMGFRTTGAGTREVPKYHMASLGSKGMGTWPPVEERKLGKDWMVMCPDLRTAVLFKLEAFDLDDKGFSVFYFRRAMSILDKIIKKPGIEVDKILDEYPDKFERETIYPPLHKVIIQVFAEELEQMNYIELKDGKATATEKGMAKYENFKQSLTPEEREALKV